MSRRFCHRCYGPMKGNYCPWCDKTNLLYVSSVCLIVVGVVLICIGFIGFLTHYYMN